MISFEITQPSLHVVECVWTDRRGDELIQNAGFDPARSRKMLFKWRDYVYI
jgi:hypothetical protein